LFSVANLIRFYFFDQYLTESYILKYLITGGNGFVGTFLKDRLLREGNEVKTLGRSSENNFQLDLSKEYKSISENFDVIIHSASIVHNSVHAGSFHEQLILDDLEITMNFLRSIENISFQKIIFLSSVSVYGIEYGRDIDTSQPLSPKSGYGSHMIRDSLERKIHIIEEFDHGLKFV